MSSFISTTCVTSDIIALKLSLELLNLLTPRRYIEILVLNLPENNFAKLYFYFANKICHDEYEKKPVVTTWHPSGLRNLPAKAHFDVWRIHYENIVSYLSK